MTHSAVPCSSHQSAPATSLCGGTVGPSFVLYLLGLGLQDIEQEAPVAACLWQSEGSGLSASLRNGQLRTGLYKGKMLRRYSQGSGQLVCCDCWLGYFYFAPAKEAKCRAMHLLRGTGTDREPACQNRRPCVPSWPSPLVSQPFSPALRPGFASLFPKYWVHHNKNCQEEWLRYLFICKFFSVLRTANIANRQIYNPYWRQILLTIFFFWENQHGLVPQGRNRMSGTFKALWHPSMKNPKQQQLTKQTNKHKNKANTPEF